MVSFVRIWSFLCLNITHFDVVLPAVNHLSTYMQRQLIVCECGDLDFRIKGHVALMTTNGVID